MSLNILPNKSWHVWNRKNLARVERDEAVAAGRAPPRAQGTRHHAEPEEWQVREPAQAARAFAQSAMQRLHPARHAAAPWYTQAAGAERAAARAARADALAVDAVRAPDTVRDVMRAERRRIAARAARRRADPMVAFVGERKSGAGGHTRRRAAVDQRDRSDGGDRRVGNKSDAGDSSRRSTKRKRRTEPPADELAALRAARAARERRERARVRQLVAGDALEPNQASRVNADRRRAFNDRFARDDAGGDRRHHRHR